MSSLPDEIIVNIFSRLPVKSLLRFRSVCKPWSKLVSDPDFVKMHFNHAIENNNFSLMLRDYYLYSVDYDSSSSSLSLSDEAVEIDYPFKSSRYWVKILATKEYKKIPKTPIEHPMGYGIIRAIKYGFGYDCNIEDYKLVRIVDFYGYDSEVKVYTLGSNSWRRIQYIPYNFSVGSIFGVLVNGALHWIAKHYIRSEASRLILSLDIRDETFQEVPQPENLNDQLHITFGVLGEYLCILDNCLYMVGVEVWVMKDYGVRESWTKLFTIALQTVVQSFQYLRLIQCFNNGEILLQKDNNALVLYNPKHERTRILKIRGIPKRFETVTYVGSLVSLNSGTYVEQEQVLQAIEHKKKIQMEKRKTRVSLNSGTCVEQEQVVQAVEHKKKIKKEKRKTRGLMLVFSCFSK
ncbi:F-box domain [Macleaya cordata]|uniref:F-box domain n=1 Tax=Macleaya cordata TaxID=56857 RepID=A0A200PSQ4_MACCD|nr:F-box domain [Macleaya cordata]